MSGKDLIKMKLGLTEWFRKSGSKNLDKFLLEDRQKEERLSDLNQWIDLPVCKIVEFQLEEVVNKNNKFINFSKENHKNRFSFRLVPKEKNLPLHRIKDVTITQALNWLNKQNIPVNKYKVYFKLFTKNISYSVLMIVSESGIKGEVIEGMGLQLTVGNYLNNPPIRFSYNFKSWKYSRKDKKAKAFVHEVVKNLIVKDTNLQRRMRNKWKSTFTTSGYLCGYFECIKPIEYGLWFLEYNKTVGKLLSKTFVKKYRTTSTQKALVEGSSASPGLATGCVRLVTVNGKCDNFNKGDVLVSEFTSPEHVLLIKKSSSIVTDKGGILSHAAIVAREFGKPCIVGCGNATKTLEDGMFVEVDATNGIVRLLTKQLD